MPIGHGISPAATIPSGAGSPAGSNNADRVTAVTIGDHDTLIRHGNDVVGAIPWGAVNLTQRWLVETDPPRPDALTNALGAVTDHLDDIVRQHPGLLDVDSLTLFGSPVESLARVEIGRDDVSGSIDLTRRAADEIFRIVATEPTRDRAFNPGLPSSHVETIVASCSIVLALMRRLHLDRVTLQVGHRT